MSSRTLNIIIVFVTVLWGVSWASAKYLAMNMPLMELTFWRFVVTAIFAYIALLAVGQRSVRVPRSSLFWILSGGIFMGVVQILNFAGLEAGYAGLASIIFNATSPIFSFILAFMFLRRPVSTIDSFALFLGALGAMIIFNFWRLDVSRVILSGNFYFLIHALGFAFVTLCSQKASLVSSAGAFTFYMGVIGALVVLPFCTHDGVFQLFSKDWIFWANLLFMAGVSGGFATTVYFFAVSKLGSARSSSFIFLVPLSSVVAAEFAFDEHVSIWSIVGGVLSLAAVYLLNTTNKYLNRSRL